MPEILVSPSAEMDLIEIWRYSFHQWGEKQADLYLSALDNAIQLLAENPELGRSIEDIRTGYRLLGIKNHLIIYRRIRTRLVIMRVLGAEMDVPRHV